MCDIMTFLFEDRTAPESGRSFNLDASDAEVDFEVRGGYYGDDVSVFIPTLDLEYMAKEARKHEAAYRLDQANNFGGPAVDWGE